MKRSWRERVGDSLRYLADRIDRVDEEVEPNNQSLTFWDPQIKAWLEYWKQNKDRAPKQYLVVPRRQGRTVAMSEIRRLMEQGVIHQTPDPPYLEFNEEPEPGNPAYWWAYKHSPCFYKPEWTDEVGTVLVCRIHKNNSRHDVSEGFDKPCLTVDPYPKEEANDESPKRT